MELTQTTSAAIKDSTANHASKYLPNMSPLSETLWRNVKNVKNPPIASKDGTSAWLTWKDLTVCVSNATGETHAILDNLSGYAEPAFMTAIMGPSGSGKSTLLDALAGINVFSF